MTGRARRRVRLIPLTALLVVAVVATGVGLAARHRLDAAAAAAAPAPVTASAAPTAAPVTGGLPASCHPAVAAPSTEPWIGDRAAASEFVWATHAAEMRTAYIRGSDGSVDWGDIQAQNLSQAVGRRLLSTSEVASWHRYLATVRGQLAAAGIPFYIVVTPSKWGAFPEQLPSWAQAIRGSGPLDQLLVAGQDLPIIDLRAALRAAAAAHPTYSRVNSHWTDYGAWVGWQQIAACLDATAPQLGRLSAPPIDGVTVSDQFDEFAPLGVTDPSPDWTIPDFAPALAPVTLTTADGATSTVAGDRRTGLLELPASTRTAGAQTASTALIIRDSFGDSLSVDYQQSFAATWQVRHDFDSTPIEPADIAALVAAHHPDVVILQIAQRHLTFPPPTP